MSQQVTPVQLVDVCLHDSWRALAFMGRCVPSISQLTHQHARQSKTVDKYVTPCA